MKLTNGLLGLGAMLIASQVNAAAITVNPDVTKVVVGEAFTLTVSGDFSGEPVTIGGGVILAWDSSQLQLIDSIAGTRASIEATIQANNWILPNQGNLKTNDVSGDGQVDWISVDVISFTPKTTFGIFSLNLVGIPPPSSGPINITASALSDLTSGWEGRPVDYFGATFTVTTATVPVPAAVWLFGSGLLGLVGLARRKKA